MTRRRRSIPTANRCSLKKEQTWDPWALSSNWAPSCPHSPFPSHTTSKVLSAHSQQSKREKKKQKLYPVLSATHQRQKLPVAEAKSRERRKKRGRRDSDRSVSTESLVYLLFLRGEIEDLSEKEGEQSSSSVHPSCLSGRGKGASLQNHSLPFAFLRINSFPLSGDSLLVIEFSVL
ncbi:hypothetical protein SLA2020_249570 [Shorea laevis]